MKLIKFRILDYKSIKDSGWCWLASDVTTLAGKNESGKSSILEALRDFGTNTDVVPENAMPIDRDNRPIMELCFEVETRMLMDVSRKARVVIHKEARAYLLQNNLTLKKYHDGRYDLEDTVNGLLNKRCEERNKRSIVLIENTTRAMSKVEMISSISKPEYQGDIAAYKQSVNQYIEQASNIISSNFEGEAKGTLNDSVGKLKEANSTLNAESSTSKFLNELVKRIPSFIFFSDFLNILPFEIPLTEALNNSAVQDFAKVSGLDLNKIANEPDSLQRRNLLGSHSASVSGNFKSYWEQDQLDIVAEPDGENLRFGIRESGSPLLFKPEHRSKGFQWFLSFYLRLVAEQGGTKVILIDEPGSYLHAKAQIDILKVFESISTEESQIIISTHSPYLIDPNRLDRVRLVLKEDEKGTWVENKIHRGTDTETLTPIVTAIGLDLSNEFSIAGKKNVLLEGISDYYFLQAFRKFVKTEEVSFIPCVGAGKIPQLVSLLIGWGLDYLVVLDNDPEGKKIAKELSERLLVGDNQMIPISDQTGFAIEDLFTHDDFNKFVLQKTKNNDKKVSNSKFLKNERLDKVLLAKTFFETVQGAIPADLSEETLDNFKKVCQQIDEQF